MQMIPPASFKAEERDTEGKNKKGHDTIFKIKEQEKLLRAKLKKYVKRYNTSHQCLRCFKTRFGSLIPKMQVNFMEKRIR